MKIIHIASEFAPIAKVGGLGDVVYGLAKQQKKEGAAARGPTQMFFQKKVLCSN